MATHKLEAAARTGFHLTPRPGTTSGSGRSTTWPPASGRGSASPADNGPRSPRDSSPANTGWCW